MKLIIDAKRWLSHISSDEIIDEPIKEVRLVQLLSGHIDIYVNGRETPETHIEPVWDGIGERVFILGDHETYEPPKLNWREDV